MINTEGQDKMNQKTESLDIYGWSPLLESARKACGRPDWVPARVLAEHRHIYQMMTPFGMMRGEVSGKYRIAATGTGDFPAVGDWVMVEARPREAKASIQTLLPRHSRFSRKAAGGRPDEQVMAANFNTVLLVMSLNRDFNLRRLERYLVMAWDSDAQPVVVLTKRDLAEGAEVLIEEAKAVAAGVPVIAVSAVTGEGMEELGPWMQPGQTLVVLGSSGVGKSTLMNRLAGKELALTKEIREDDARGRHTTTHRELFLLDSGVLILDTPGIRELQLWESDDGIEDAFSDIQALSAKCKFRDCTHKQEPGCSVRLALEGGTLDEARYMSYHKLEREMAYLSEKRSHSSGEADRKFGKAVTKMMREREKARG